eukprot:3396813-Rhodomonas_salina.3
MQGQTERERDGRERGRERDREKRTSAGPIVLGRRRAGAGRGLPVCSSLRPPAAQSGAKSWSEFQAFAHLQ